MRRGRIFDRFFSLQFILISLAMGIFTWLAVHTSRHFFIERNLARLEREAKWLGGGLAPLFPDPNTDEVLRRCRDLVRDPEVRFRVMLPSGRMLGETLEENIRWNEAVGKQPNAGRRSDDEEIEVMVPILKDKATVGIVAVSMSVDALDSLTVKIQKAAFLVWLALAGMLAGITHYQSRRLGKQLASLRIWAARFSRGKLDRELAVTGVKEIGALAETLNFMAGRLAEDLEQLRGQYLEREMVIQTMTEGVLTVDLQQKVLLVNPAAARLLGFPIEEFRDRHFRDLVGHPELQGFMVETLGSESPVREAIVLHRGEERVFQAHGAPLRGPDGNRIGVLIVLNDMTPLWERESLQKDFVANVSHELKTPITSIKGAVETLINGAVDNKDDARHFLSMVFRHAERLNQIIEDLLSLSRIDRDHKHREIRLSVDTLDEVLANTLETCAQNAREQGITLSLTCPSGAAAYINPPLLEQAVVNLVDNAVKYSLRGSTVFIEVVETETECAIRVKDHGRGIEKKHLPQLFNRFFRVDAARSRRMGGTGLGLAIVKLIARAHGGRVSVESAPGKGSTFSIHLSKTQM